MVLSRRSRSDCRVVRRCGEALGTTVQRGFIEVFIQPGIRNRRKRVYRSVRIQGCEIVRFMKTHVSRVGEGYGRLDRRALSELRHR